MTIPETSIVIPTYNHQNYIREAIESVLDQTYQNYEVIIIDDGSHDNTREVVANFGDSVRYIWQKNQGLSAARNTGIKNSTGKYICFLDSDDLYEPDYLTTLIRILKKNPNVDAVYCSARAVDQKNHPLPQIIGKSLLPDHFHAALLKGGFFPPSCMVAQAYCYKNGNRFFNESLHRVEDLDLWLKFAQFYRVLGIDNPLVRYRILPQSLSTDPKMVLTNRIEVLKNHYNAMDSHPLPVPLNEALGRSYIAAAIEYLQLHDTDQALHSIIEGTSLAPDLVTDFGICYELALGDQPRGYRGDFSTNNQNYNFPTLLRLLDQLFSGADIPVDKKNIKNKVYANANKAFGFIAYGARNFRTARIYLFRAIILDPFLVCEPQIITRIIKSFFPSKLIDRLKKLRWSLAISHIN